MKSSREEGGVQPSIKWLGLFGFRRKVTDAPDSDPGLRGWDLFGAVEIPQTIFQSAANHDGQRKLNPDSYQRDSND